MFNDPRILHESVADVLTDIGVRKDKGRVNPANNAPPTPPAGPQAVNESDNESAIVEMCCDKCDCDMKKDGDGYSCPKCKGTKGKKKVDEASMPGETTGKGKKKRDETDGEPDSSTVVDASSVSPEVTVGDTPTDVDVNSNTPMTTAAEAIAEAFYDAVPQPLIILWEKEDMSDAEIFGLNEEDIAPCGGTPPCIPAKLKNAAKKTKTRIDDKGHDALVLHAKKDMATGGKDVIGGTMLSTVGWKSPDRGKGKTVSGGTKG